MGTHTDNGAAGADIRILSPLTSPAPTTARKVAAEFAVAIVLTIGVFSEFIKGEPS